MPIADLLNLPCTIVTRAPSGTLDEYNNPIDAETSIDTVCELQQRARPESTAGGTVAVTEWALFLPAGTAVDVGALVVVAGAEYEVRGVPWEARNPRSRAVSHIEATVVATQGKTRGSGS